MTRRLLYDHRDDYVSIRNHTNKGPNYFEKFTSVFKVRHLELRRLYFDMRMVYKITHGLIDVVFDDLFTFSSNLSPGEHVYKLYCAKSNLNVRSHFFSQRYITAWNSLPNDVVTSPSLSIFNNKLYNVNFQKKIIISVFIIKQMHYYQLLYYTNIVLYSCTYFYCHISLF